MKASITFIASIFSILALSAFTFKSVSDGFYRIDTKESTIIWNGSKITGKTHFGNVSLVEGGLQVVNGKVSGGKFTIDMTSITVKDLEGDMAKKLEGHLKGEDFFSVEKFKTANLTIKSVNGNDVKADLTIKGITHEVSFPVVLSSENGTLVAKADIEVDRSKYDVRYGSDSFFDNLGDKAIDNIIKFSVTLKGKSA
jgi:polyisoprenoid-binding protein YceI